MGTRACKGDEADDTILIPLRVFFVEACHLMFAV